MFGLIGRFWRMPVRRKLMLLEAFLSTLSAWAVIKFVPYAAWRSKLGTPVPLSTTAISGSSARTCGKPVLEDIAWAHAQLERRFGSQFTCLMLAFSAKAMLRRRKHSSVLILGVKRSPEAAKDKLGAHAWVLSEGYEIVGSDTRDGHAPIAAYCG